ncbi:Beta-glucosidase 18, partial [Mucuna pruriens]
MRQRRLTVVITLLCCVQFHVRFCHEVEDGISRSHFPEGFLFGTSTSSYQIEGAPFEDGRGLSNWDVFSHTPGKIKNDENGDIADDHYHRYLEDIELISSLGVNVYRFSISWTRILPRGIYGDINPSGIMFYNKIIDNLLLRGIEPFVTIHHYDLPQELEERYGGWISPLIQKDFVRFAEICFKSFGDRVKYWITMNEPNLVGELAYKLGIYSPGHCSPPFGNCYNGNSDVEPLIVIHNMLLSHAKAVELYRKYFQVRGKRIKGHDGSLISKPHMLTQAKQGGTIGIVAFTFMYEALRDEECDKQAVNRALAFATAWVLDPLYPAEMRSILGSQLPVFTPKEKSLIKGSLDFIGINHYGTLYAKDCSLSACSPEADHPISGFVETSGTRDGIPIGDQTGMEKFFVVPRGMEKIVDYMKIRYHNMPMYITENGYSSLLKPDVTKHDLLQDLERIEFHKAYLSALIRAIRKGADVRGYIIWSLLDNFEWTSGYDTRFGLYYVDRHTLERIPKLSVQWFSSFLNNTISFMESFGDRVKYWTTINEPSLIVDFAYMRGSYPPGHCSPPFGNCYTGNSDVEPLIAMHNMLLSHAKAVELYRKHFQAKQGGTIGIVAYTIMYEPLRDENVIDKLVLDPLVFGEYPAEMRSILGNQLPVFSPKEKSLIKGSLDFIGINHYGILYAKDCSLSACSPEANHPISGFVETSGTRDGIAIGDQTGMTTLFVVPRGMEKIVDYIKIRYHNMPMYITENGA